MQKRLIIFLAFFSSGFLGLAYELIWIRELTLVFGATAYAMSAVLSAFMGGLALGSAVIGRISDRIEKKILMYAILEIGIGLFALLFPLLLGLTEDLYLFVYTKSQGAPALNTAVRFILSVILLLLPTALMGGTLPLLAKAMTRHKESVGRMIGFLYGLNTFGGVAGVFFTGFIGLRAVGVSKLLLYAGCANILVGIIVLLSVREKSLALRREAEGQARKHKETDRQRTGRRSERRIRAAVLWAMGLSGFASLAYEVVWTRVLSMTLRSNIYAFTIILASFLLGIAVGSWVISIFMKRISKPISLLVVIEIAIAVFGVLSTFLIEGMNEVVDVIADSIGLTTWWKLQAGRLLVASVLFLIPSVLLGLAFPIASQIIVLRFKTLGERLGFLYSANTVGAVLGSFSSGFLIIPYLGVGKAAVFIATLNVFAAAILIMGTEQRRGSKPIKLALPLVLASLASNFLIEAKPFIGKLRNVGGPDLEIMYYSSGIGATVTVIRSGYTGYRQLYTNGIIACSDSYDALQTVKMLGHLPLLIHPDPQDILIIGFGIGVTSASVASHPVSSIDCIEIAPDVPKAASIFSDLNESVLYDDRFNLFIDDGRSFILTTQKKYDVISCDPIHPAFGSSALYTLDYYKLCREKLAEGGIVCQYLPFHELSSSDYRVLLKTFNEVFPHTYVWLATYQTVLMGSLEPLLIDAERLKSRLETAEVKRSIAGSGLDTPEAILSRLLLAEEEVSELTRGSQINSDDIPVLEFSEKRSFRVRTHRENLPMVLSARADLERIISLIDQTTMDKVNIDTLTSLYKSRGLFLRASIKRLEDDPSYIIDFFNAYRLAPYDEDIRFLEGPELTRYLLNRARGEMRNGLIEKAREYVTMALDLTPNSKDALRLLKKLRVD